MRYAGKTVIVTGASAGLGEALALGFGKEGANVLINYYLNEDREQVEIIRKKIETSGGHAIGFKADVRSGQEVHAMVEAAVETFGALDILINNAGIMEPYTALADMSEEAFDQVLAVDLKGVFLCCKYAIPQMLKQGKGVITNIASVAAVSAASGDAAYAAAKSGVVGLTRKITYDYGEAGIRCNAVCPGTILTPMTKKIFHTIPEREKFVTGVPAGRCSTPDEIAGYILFLCSEEADFIHGQTCVIDGGWTVRKKYL